MNDPEKQTDSDGKQEEVSQAEFYALASFRLELVRFLDFSKRAAESVGLTAPQYQALLFIKGFSNDGRLTLSELVEKLLTAHNAVIELLDRMEVAGLVRRSVEEWDKRRVIVHLTPKAERKLQRLAAMHLEELQRSGVVGKVFLG